MTVIHDQNVFHKYIEPCDNLIVWKQPFDWNKVKFESESILLFQGSMLQVSPHFLEQTLDKKLMSDLRVSN